MAAKLLLSDGSRLLLTDFNSRLLLAVDDSEGAVNASSTKAVSATSVTSTLTQATGASSTISVSDG